MGRKIVYDYGDDVAAVQSDPSVAVDEDGNIIAELDENGAEVLDDTPIEPPVGYNEQPDMWVTLQNMIKSRELAREASEADFGTFEEEDDFEVGDDYDPQTPYENDYDPPIAEMMKAGKEEIAKQEEVAKETPPVTGSGDKEPVRQDLKPEKTTSSEANKEGSKG